MQNNLDYRVATPKDAPQLVELMNSQYARKKTEAYFNWQFFNSQYPTILLCAVDNDKIIGMFGLQKRLLKSGATVGQAIDLLLKPAYRGMGIFKEMGNRVSEMMPGLDLMCVLPNLNGKNACEKALGFKVIGKIDSLELSSIHEPKSNYTETLFDSHVNDLDQFTYSNNILHWRFDSNPDYSYKYVRNGKCVFGITKIFEDPITQTRYGDIVNIFCDINEEDAAREIYCLCAEALFKQKVKSVTTWALPNTNYFKILTGIGFRAKPQERYFCVKVLNSFYERLNKLENWHLVQSDAEIY